MILSIDQGTSGTTVIIFDLEGTIRGQAYSEFQQYFPQPGWVEHDAEEIWRVTRHTMVEAVADAGITFSMVQAIGITNQRETTLVWDRNSGAPLYRAIVWQCRRSAEICEHYIKAGKRQWIYNKTGLVIDAYFSATKLQWLFHQQPQLARQAAQGDLCFGTIDSWLIWKLTGGRKHLTDHSNASRTMLYNIDTHDWDEELLGLFSIPRHILPEIRPSAGEFGYSDCPELPELDAPISGVAGDQQAALFAQGCTSRGDIKNTYGTGCFMLMYAGKHRPYSESGLLTTIACDKTGQPGYALEGAVFTAGAGIQWLRDELQLIEHAADSEAVAESIDSTQGVFVVPAFTGLGAPHWDMHARAIISGLTRGAGRAEIVRAMLESIAYQSRELADLMANELVEPLQSMRVDGGASANNFLMQFQSDIMNVEIQRPVQLESTAIGAALLAGLGAGLWANQQLPESFQAIDNHFRPQMDKATRNALFACWLEAVSRAISK